MEILKAYVNFGAFPFNYVAGTFQNKAVLKYLFDQIRGLALRDQEKLLRKSLTTLQVLSIPRHIKPEGSQYSLSQVFLDPALTNLTNSGTSIFRRKKTAQNVGNFACTMYTKKY